MARDIRLSLSFRESRKKKKLQNRLGPEGVLAIIELWIGVASSKPSGVLTGWDEDDIALEGNYLGNSREFVQCLLELKLLDNDNGVFKIHNWVKNQPWVADSENRSEMARRKVLFRWCNACIDTEKQAVDFKEWFNNIYKHNAGDNTESILAVYQLYCRSNSKCNTPLLSFPLLTSPKETLPTFTTNNVSSTTHAREGDLCLCKQGVVLDGVCEYCGLQQ